jgi:hypothetical protein
MTRMNEAGEDPRRQAKQEPGMHRTDDPDLWIASQVDPWVLAAAHAGDIRAMRFAARRAYYRRSDVYERLLDGAGPRPEELGLPDDGAVGVAAREAGRRERAFWSTQAAEHGDAESIAALLEEIGSEHQKQHLHHLMAVAKYSTGLAEGFRGGPGLIELFLFNYPIAVAEAGPLRDLQERWDIEISEAGARDGCEPCVTSRAERERGHEPGQAEADRRQGRAEMPAKNQPGEPRFSKEFDELGNRAVSALIWSDAEWVATLTDLIPPWAHRMQHLLRLLAAARYPPDRPEPGGHRDPAGWWAIELCRTAAGEGASFERERCIERWAEYQLHHGPGYQAELRLRQERAEQELTKRLPPPPPPRFAGGPVTAATIITTAVITSVLVPFVQTMITKAAEDSYQGLRRHLKACFSRVMMSHETPHRDDQLLVVRPPEGQHPGAVLQIWTDLPDEAISALSQLLYNLRTAQPPLRGAECRWYWNGTISRWEALQLPEEHRRPPS